MTAKTIKVVEDFSAKPKGRYHPEDGDSSGERFRDEYLIPELTKAIREDRVLIVDLGGYNRYGPSFIDEAFGALASIANFDLEDLNKHLVIKHEALKSVVESALSRMKFHNKNKKKIVESYEKRLQEKKRQKTS